MWSQFASAAADSSQKDSSQKPPLGPHRTEGDSDWNHVRQTPAAMIPAKIPLSVLIGQMGILAGIMLGEERKGRKRWKSSMLIHINPAFSSIIDTKPKNLTFAKVSKPLRTSEKQSKIGAIVIVTAQCL